MNGRFIDLNLATLLQDMLDKRRFRFMTEPDGEVVLVKVHILDINTPLKGHFFIGCSVHRHETDQGVYSHGNLNPKDLSVIDPPPKDNDHGC